uniref:Uncharacterized protein n=1 Tax=Rhizophora mucronata TaxID=61149 RepID=A0A2P2KPP9_RHIMU
MQLPIEFLCRRRFQMSMSWLSVSLIVVVSLLHSWKFQ